MNPARSIFKWIFRLVLLYVLFIACFIAGGLVVGGAIQAGTQSEPGLVSDTSGLLIIALADLLIILSLIQSSRWSGWRLSVSLALAYYGAVTLETQIETWYFLSSITVSPQLLPRLFLMGVPIAFLFIPLAVLLLGKGRTGNTIPSAIWLESSGLTRTIKMRDNNPTGQTRENSERNRTMMLAALKKLLER